MGEKLLLAILYTWLPRLPETVPELLLSGKDSTGIKLNNQVTIYSCDTHLALTRQQVTSLWRDEKVMMKGHWDLKGVQTLQKNLVTSLHRMLSRHYSSKRSQLQNGPFLCWQQWQLMEKWCFTHTWGKYMHVHMTPLKGEGVFWCDPTLSHHRM